MEKTDHLAELRKQTGLSQEDAAAALGVSRQTISRWENGVSVPTGENLRALAQLYETSVDALLREDTALPDGESAAVKDPAHPAPRRKLRRRILAALLVLLAIAAAVVCYILRANRDEVKIGELESEPWVETELYREVPLEW